MAQAVDRENKPTDIRNFMEKTGASFDDSVDLLYGVVGANRDTRNWKEIMSSSDPLAAARQATFEMYSGTDATEDTSKSGKYASFQNPSAKAAIVSYTDPSSGKTNYSITAADGTALRAGYASEEQARKDAVNFGISDIVSGAYFEPTKKPVVQQPSATQQQAAQQSTGFTPTPAQPQPPITQQVTPPTYGTQPIRVTPTTPQVAGVAGTYPMAPVTGTFSVPTATGQLSAVPQTITYRPSYTGTPGNVPETLYQAQQMQQQQAQGVRNVMYRNAAGATMYITEVNGQPMTDVPAGYTKVEGQASAAYGISWPCF
jgi:hypothetical protein